MVRAPFYDKDGIKKGAWSLQEDDKLRACILKYGHPNWRELPKLAGLSRCGKSCRLRWMNYLKPGVKRGNYTQEEEKLITQLREKIGNKWSEIAARLPGRTDNEIKNHWHTHLKKRTKIMKPKQSNQLLNKEHSSESSQCEAESTTADPSSDQVLSDHQILDNSQSLCPEETTSNMNNECLSSSSSSSDSNNAYVPTTTTAIHSLPADHIFIGDFWTEPFVQDDMYNDYHPTYFVEGGGLILPNAYFFYDDVAMDMFCQATHKFQQD